MRKRHVKKLAKNAKQNMQPYRQALAGSGSKKLNRRRRSMGRYWPKGLQPWSDSKAMERQLRQMANQTFGCLVEGNFDQAAAMLLEATEKFRASVSLSPSLGAANLEPASDSSQVAGVMEE